MSFTKSIYSEGIAAEHPDIEDQEEFRKKADEIIAARKKRRAQKSGPQLPGFIKTSRKQQNEEKDHEHSMARSEIHKIDNAIKTLRKKVKGEGNLEAWVQSKITRAADYLDAVSNYLDSGEHNQVEEGYEDDIPELRSKTVTDRSSTSSSRKSRKSPGELMRMLNQDTPSKPKKKKKKKLEEETMTPEQKAKEDKLKKKYDDSEMKQNMIDQYGKERGTQIYFAKIRKMAMEELEQVDDYLDEAKLSRTERRSRRAGKPGYDAEGKPKTKGGVRAWDMDETLFRNDPKKIRVHVKDKEGKPVQSLTNQEFNTHKLDKDKGHEYDFSEFRSSKKFADASTPNKSMVKKLKKQVRRGKPVHIVTARGSFDDQPTLAKHLRKHGIEIDKGKLKGGRHVHFHRAGDMEGSDIGEKKRKIVRGLMAQHGTSRGHMYDDAAKVHRAMKKDNSENSTSSKIKTHMVQPNKKGITQARSFKEEFDLDLIYDFIIEQLILEEIAEDYEDASIILDELDDDILDELVSESYEFIQNTLEEDYQMTEEKEFRIDYQSPYKKIQEKREIKKDYLQEEIELTPYEYWKSFIGDTEDVEDIVNEEKEEYDELDIVEEDIPQNSYEKWKRYLEEAPYVGRPVGRGDMVASNIARGVWTKTNL